MGPAAGAADRAGSGRGVALAGATRGSEGVGGGTDRRRGSCARAGPVVPGSRARRSGAAATIVERDALARGRRAAGFVRARRVRCPAQRDLTGVSVPDQGGAVAGSLLLT